MESPTSVRPFLRPTAFEFWSQRFTDVTVPSSLKGGLCTPAMYRYWQEVMTSFKQELVGSRGFSLIPPDGLSMQGFCLGRSTREHFLRMLGSVMNNIEHNFVDTVSTERIL